MKRLKKVSEPNVVNILNGLKKLKSHLKRERKNPSRMEKLTQSIPFVVFSDHIFCKLLFTEMTKKVTVTVMVMTQRRKNFKIN